MIKVVVCKKNKVIESIKCSGHACYAEYGKDIVCAAFSTMVTVTVNSILGFDRGAIRYTTNKDIVIINIKKDDITNKLLKVLVKEMKELRHTYSKNINIKEENHE